MCHTRRTRFRNGGCRNSLKGVSNMMTRQMMMILSTLRSNSRLRWEMMQGQQLVAWPMDQSRQPSSFRALLNCSLSWTYR